MIQIVCGDITQLAVDAIVNAANSQLVGGGGVDGAIHRAAGYKQLQQACSKLGGCATGDVKVTKGFNLSARYIFHTVGPVWRGGGHNEQELLASCYRQTMAVAQQHRISSIAFPAISCGVYGYPPALAATIAVEEVSRAVVENPVMEQVVFCCFDEPMVYHYQVAMSALG